MTSRRTNFASAWTWVLPAFLLLSIRSSRGAAQAGQAGGPSDTLVFTSDEQLKGELLKADGSGVTFKSPVAGELKVKWANIKEVRSEKAFAVIARHQKLTRADAVAQVPTGPVVVQGNQVVVSAGGQGKALPTADIDQVVNAAEFDRVVNHPPNLLHGWVGAVNSGVSLVRATQNSTTFSGNISLIRAVPAVDWLPARNRTSLDYSQAYGSTSQPSNAVVKTNIFHAGAERDEYFSPRLYAFAAAAFDHNFSQGLDLQQQYGGGIGYTVLKNNAQELDVKADVHYEKQHFFAPTIDQNLFGSNFGETYHRSLPRAILLDQFASISASWNNTNAYSARAGANLTFPVYRGFSFNVGATDEYLNNAPTRFKKNSVTFTSGVAYTFKQ